MPLRILASTRIPDGWVARFAEAHDLTYQEWDDSQPPAGEDELVARLTGQQVLITEADQVTAEVIRRAADLAIVIDMRAAPVNVNVEAATEAGIVVINTPGRNADAVGDLTLAMMIMVARNVWPAMSAVRSGRWLERGLLPAYLDHQGMELPGKTVGLIGLGATGLATARRLLGFSVHLIAHDPFVDTAVAADVGARLVALDELLVASDFVSLHVPLMPATVGMIGARELELMRPTAFLINSARAKLVDGEALLDTLDHGRIGGAALDVYESEPLEAKDPLTEMSNVVLLPHIGGATHEVVDHQSRIAWECLETFLGGGARNIVNPEAMPAARRRLGLATD